MLVLSYAFRPPQTATGAEAPVQSVQVGDKVTDCTCHLQQAACIHLSLLTHIGCFKHMEMKS